MDFLVVGDVHGCYYTFQNLIDKHWNKDSERLIQLGDLIDRGKNAPQMVELAKALSEDVQVQATFLKGNHEYLMEQYFFEGPNANWLRVGGANTLLQYEKVEKSCRADAEWLSKLPLFFETDNLYISHAGISELAEDPFVQDSEYGILWNRSPLKNLGKLQVIGHTPGENPVYDAHSHTWNIDTGAAYSRYLSGVKIDEQGEILGFIREETDSRDL